MTRLFITGFSSGGQMTYHRACRKPGKFRAFVASGSDADESINGCVAKPAPIVIIYGNGEEEFGKWSRSTQPHWFRHNGCTADRAPQLVEPCQGATSCTGAPTVSCVFSGGHTWPSFAAQAAWRFFSTF
jgi:poly(3-hydroxybutyrate) depolymerase